MVSKCWGEGDLAMDLKRIIQWGVVLVMLLECSLPGFSTLGSTESS